MFQTIRVFIDIALWRKGPQDLPASTRLLAFVTMWYVGLSYAQVRLLGVDIQPALILTAVDVAMVSAWLALVLSLFGLRSRLTQALTAVLGVGAMLSLLDVAIRATLLLIGVGDSGLYAWALLRLILILLLTGRIFAIALERGLMTGVALTLAVIFSTDAIGSVFVDLNSVAANVRGQ